MSEPQDTGFSRNEAIEVRLLGDSSSSTSKSSDDASSELLHTSSSSSPKKRKVQGQKDYKSRLKRLKMSYNDNYRALFNITVNEIVNGLPVNEEDLLPMSQIGVTQWSSCEKEIFFTMLATRGRHGLSSIAAAIGSKSELEVHFYMQLLQSATAEHQLNTPHHRLLGSCEIPGAFEISQDCSVILELRADALSLLQQKEEEELERRNYDRLWLLNEDTAGLVAHGQSSAGSDEAETLHGLAPFELLDLKGFLELSKCVFMNSSRVEDNWRSYCDREETPSILHTAFTDFFRLAISVTKRLIQSSLFVAMSRIRTSPSSSHSKTQVLMARDVSAAIDILGMKHDSQSFWIKVARRCNLAVCDYFKGSNSIKEELRYDEVEKRLARSANDAESVEYSATPNEISTTLESTPLSLETDCDSFLSESLPNSYSDSAGSSDDSESVGISSQHGSHSRNRNTAGYQDFYADAIDIRNSRREEIRLRKLLGQYPRIGIRSEETELPKHLGPERKTADDLDDWRSWIIYAPEWEVYEERIPASSFAARRRRGSTESRTRFYDGNSTESNCSESEGMEDDNEVSSTTARKDSPYDDEQDNEDDGERVST